MRFLYLPIDYRPWILNVCFCAVVLFFQDLCTFRFASNILCLLKVGFFQEQQQKNLFFWNIFILYYLLFWYFFYFFFSSISLVNNKHHPDSKTRRITANCYWSKRSCRLLRISSSIATSACISGRSAYCWVYV